MLTEAAKPSGLLSANRIKDKSRSFFLVLASALSLSIGWGIRGNFGHETGAMIPGALAAMAAVMLSGREDWLRRTPYFAFFGALGWSFGGSISYMQVIAYTHSGHSGSVLYGFACLFLIGFLWAAMGGAGTALPALLKSAELRDFFPAVIAVFIGWCIQDILTYLLVHVDSAFRQNDPLYWYDTDWLAALVAIVCVLVWGAIRKRLDRGTALVLHMAIGWWIGFLVLVVLFGWRMTPPRGDNWAGCLGMVLGMFVYFGRRVPGLAYAALLSGIIGGIGFALADAVKLLGIYSGWQTNWHSILEQTYGLINGIGIGLMMLWLSRRAPPTVSDLGETQGWTRGFSSFFVLIVITYLNFVKNVETWTKVKTVPPEMYGLSARVWFNMAYALLAIVVLALLFVQRKRRIALLAGSSLGRGQLFYLVFLWWVVIGNFERAVVGFAPQRLVTEGAIFLNALICTALVLALSCEGGAPTELPPPRFPFARLATAGLFALVVTTSGSWAIVRALYGNNPAPGANLHIRFGPNATATTAPLAKDRPHP
jgi:hypothetical protein